jgi:hypothetical protein
MRSRALRADARKSGSNTELDARGTLTGNRGRIRKTWPARFPDDSQLHPTVESVRDGDERVWVTTAEVQLALEAVSPGLVEPHPEAHHQRRITFNQRPSVWPSRNCRVLNRPAAVIGDGQRPCSGSLGSFCISFFICRTSWRGKTTPAAMRPQPFRQRLLDPRTGGFCAKVVPTLLRELPRGQNLSDAPSLCLTGLLRKAYSCSVELPQRWQRNERENTDACRRTDCASRREPATAGTWRQIIPTKESTEATKLQKNFSTGV